MLAYIEQKHIENSAKRIVGVFTKQSWGGRKGNYAIFVSDEQFDATKAVLELPHAQLIELQDCDESTDEIGRSIVKWDGPCEVQCVQAVLAFFEVESLEDVTQKMLEDARQSLDGELQGNENVTSH